MPLTGTYLRSLDEKRRVAVPKRLREEFGGDEVTHLYIAPGTERSLVLYSPREFERLAARLEGSSTQESYIRLFYASAERLDLDGQSRVRVPDRLAEFARLDREVYLLGVQNHAELWDKTTWDEFSSRMNDDFDHLAKAAWKVS